MKRAVAMPAYQKTQSFVPPPGILPETIDPQSGQLATATCPQTATEYFIAGSEPTAYCELHGGQNAQSSPGSWLGHLFGKGTASPASPPASGEGSNASSSPRPKPTPNAKPGENAAEPPAKEPEKKKGVFDRIFGIFGGSKQPADNPKPH
jgi:penicillin-binding protein 1B